MSETRRADQMSPGLRVRFRAGDVVYAGTIASTRRAGPRRIEFAFEDAFRWTFLNSDLFHRDRTGDGADEREEAGADGTVEFWSDELAPVPA
jgi:hypothetical protein